MTIMEQTKKKFIQKLNELDDVVIHSDNQRMCLIESKLTEINSTILNILDILERRDRTNLNKD